MAEGQDARVQEIRARHEAAGDPGDPHCAWCSGPDYPIWPCDVADLLEVIDAQRAVMDAQAGVSEQHRKRVQELSARMDALAAERDARIKTLENDLEHALASVGAFRQAIETIFAKAEEHEIEQGGMIVTYVLPCGPLHRAIGLARGTDAGGKLLAERDALAARLAAAEAALDAARRVIRVNTALYHRSAHGGKRFTDFTECPEPSCATAARAALADSREQAATTRTITMRCHCGRGVTIGPDPWCEGCVQSAATCDCVPVVIGEGA